MLSDHNNQSHNELGTETPRDASNPQVRSVEKEGKKMAPESKAWSCVGPGTLLGLWKLLKCVFGDSRGQWADALGQPLPLTWAE